MAQPPASEPAHDILAAEAFEVPAPDPRLHPHPLEVPGDPNDPAGATDPHDILAAEAFPMPAMATPPARGRARPNEPWHWAMIAGLAAGVAFVLARALRRG